MEYIASRKILTMNLGIFGKLSCDKLTENSGNPDSKQGNKKYHYELFIKINAQFLTYSFLVNRVNTKHCLLQ